MTLYRGDLNGTYDDIPSGTDRAMGEAWTLDAVGNWSDYLYDDSGDGSYGGASDLDQDRTHNDANEIWNATASNAITETGGQTAWASPAYSARGNMTTVPKLTSLANTYTCKYDSWNRLTEIKSGDNVVARYEYDGLNRRVKKHVDTSAPGSPDGDIDEYRHFYYNNRWQVLETRVTDDENDAPDAAKAKYQYIWSLRYIDAPVLRDENKDADDDCIDGDDQRLYYLTDANMNVTTLINTSGDAAERYGYDPYGEVTIYDDDWSQEQSAATYSNSIGFAGYFRDGESQLSCVRNRYYHPPLGRWAQRDPAGYTRGMGLYEYVRSKPITATDPSGMLDDPDPFNFFHPPLSYAVDWSSLQAVQQTRIIDLHWLGDFIVYDIWAYDAIRLITGACGEPVQGVFTETNGWSATWGTTTTTGGTVGGGVAAGGEGGPEGQGELSTSVSTSLGLSLNQSVGQSTQWRCSPKPCKTATAVLRIGVKEYSGSYVDWHWFSGDTYDFGITSYWFKGWECVYSPCKQE